MRSACPMSGSCEFAGICETGDTSLMRDAIINSPEMQILGADLSEEEIIFLTAPLVEAWNAEPCLKEKVRSIKELQFRHDLSHVSLTLGYSVLNKIDELLGVS